MTAKTRTPRQPVRVGVVGAGKMGSNHLRIYAGLKGVELAGVVDANGACAREAAARYGCRSFASAQEMAAEIDAASVAVPSSLHADVAGPLLERRRALPGREAPGDDRGRRDGAHPRGRRGRRGACSSATSSASTPPCASSARSSRQRRPRRRRAPDERGERPYHGRRRRRGPHDPRPRHRARAAGHRGRPRCSPRVCRARPATAMTTSPRRCTSPSGAIGHADRQPHHPQQDPRAQRHGRHRLRHGDYSTRSCSSTRRPGSSGSTARAAAALRPRLATERVLIRPEEPLDVEIRHFVDAVRHGTPPLVSGQDALNAMRFVWEIQRLLAGSGRPAPCPT